MGPLYGENPLYGLRELTQNAVDSVRELEHLLKVGTIANISRLSINSDVEITLNSDPWNFTIKDRGTGMNLEIVKNFFLRAGASFRKSAAWKRQFEDEAGGAKIARTGRFGVGALSAFLIGDVINIYTRHYSDQTGFGLQFHAGIDHEEIEITQKAGDVGTEITVPSDKTRILTLSRYLEQRDERAFYYLLDSPKIEFRLFVEDDGGPDLLRSMPRHNVNERVAALARSPRWISVKSDKYESVMWDRTSRKLGSSKYYASYASGYTYCNGILIGELDDPSANLLIEENSIGNVWEVVPPTVSITDHAANLPLNLARKDFSHTDERLVDAVWKSMWEEFIASLVYSNIESPSDLLAFWAAEDVMFTSMYWFPFIFGKDEFALLDKGILHDFSPSRVISRKWDASSLPEILGDKFVDRTTCLLLSRYGHHDSRSDVAASFEARPYGRLGGLDFENRHGGSNANIFSSSYKVMTEKTFNAVFELAKCPKYFYAMRSNAHRFVAGGTAYVVVSRSSDMTDPLVAQIGDFVVRACADKRKMEPMTILTGYNPEDQNSALADVWRRSFSTTTIPYARKERQMRIKSDAPILAHAKTA